MPPSASSYGTILGPTDAIHQPGSITTSFTPNVGAEQNPGTFSIAEENREEWGGHPAWNAASGELGTLTSSASLKCMIYPCLLMTLSCSAPCRTVPDRSSLASLPVLATSSDFAGGDGSFSIQQADIQPPTTQGQIETHLHPAFNITIPHPTVNTTATPPNVENTIQDTENVFRGHTSMHPSVISDWLQPFNEWLPTRRHQMMSIQGLGDPVLCRTVWIRVFGEWLQLRRLLSNQGFGDLDLLPRCWNDVFNFWLQQLLKPDTQGLDAPHASSAHAPLSTGSSVLSTSPPATAYTPDLSSPLVIRKARKRIPNAVSKLTVQEIQEACRWNGAEESVIARIAIVFPDIVKREHLKLAGQPGSSAGDQRDHQGYMEFAERCMVSHKNVKKRTRGSGAGQVQRYHCKLCGPVKRPRWKNSKDLLDHVWDTHCDPQGDGKPILSFRSTREINNICAVE